LWLNFRVLVTLDQMTHIVIILLDMGIEYAVVLWCLLQPYL